MEKKEEDAEEKEKQDDKEDYEEEDERSRSLDRPCLSNRAQNSL